MTCELRELSTPEDWAAMHRIRREVLFVPGRALGAVTYNDAHPDDLAPENAKFVLLLDGEPIGTTRLDPRGDTAIVRLVAIVPDRQRAGHGRVLERLMGEYAAARGVLLLKVNSAADAVGFYEKCGWRRSVWDANELVGTAASCVQMVKAIGRAVAA